LFDTSHLLLDTLNLLFLVEIILHLSPFVPILAIFGDLILWLKPSKQFVPVVTLLGVSIRIIVGGPVCRGSVECRCIRVPSVGSKGRLGIVASTEELLSCGFVGSSRWGRSRGRSHRRDHRRIVIFSFEEGHGGLWRMQLYPLVLAVSDRSIVNCPF